LFEGIIGGIVWVLANALYIDLKRKGRSGFSRIILFWMGIPLTWLWLVLVREGSAPEIEEAPDDAEALLAEIRRERRLRSGSSGSNSESPRSSVWPADSTGREDSGPSPERDEPES